VRPARFALPARICCPARALAFISYRLRRPRGFPADCRVALFVELVEVGVGKFGVRRGSLSGSWLPRAYIANWSRTRAGRARGPGLTSDLPVVNQ
jgi:hypothetical protein